MFNDNKAIRIKQIVEKSLFKLGVSLKRFKNINDIEIYECLYGKDAVCKKQFYNVGAGLFNHPAWTNIDHYSKHYRNNKIDIDLDLLKNPIFPIRENSAHIFYSSHTIEHITDDAALNFFKEAYRILREKGFIRVTTPDKKLFLDAVKNNDKTFWIYLCGSDYAKYHTVEEMYKEYFREDKSIEQQQIEPGGHISSWDAEKLVKMLRKAGFKTVYESKYGQSCCPVLRNTDFFDNTHPNISLYVEGIK